MRFRVGGRFDGDLSAGGHPRDTGEFLSMVYFHQAGAAHLEAAAEAPEAERWVEFLLDAIEEHQHGHFLICLYLKRIVIGFFILLPL